jgi:hypothetical protein
VNQFFDLTYQAIVAETNGSPEARRVDSDRLAETLRNILAGLPEADRQRLQAALANGTGDDDAETCWMGRTLQAEIDKLDRADQAQWMLAR